MERISTRHRSVVTYTVFLVCARANFSARFNVFNHEYVESWRLILCDDCCEYVDSDRM
jgi:hypothetical protein